MATLEELQRQMRQRSRSDPEYALGALDAEAEIRLGELLNGLYAKSGLTKTEIARRMGVSQPYVTTLLEEDFARASLPTLVKFLFALGYRITFDAQRLTSFDWNQLPSKQPARSRSQRLPTRKRATVRGSATAGGKATPSLHARAAARKAKP